MAGGIVCFLIYILLSLSGSSQVARSLLYVSLVAVPLGAILLLFGVMKGGSK
jgi:hypothetical protein